MIEDLQLEYPNKYSFDFVPVRGRDRTLMYGYKRHSRNAKHVISLGWDNLTRDQADALEEMFSSQFINFDTLTFLFENARMNEDLGPIEVFMTIGQIELKENRRYAIDIILQEQ